ncbi:MAG: hypothetical protein H0U74_20915 [Bradymonadaceae bacterium]|nr:hypothetical protein [Lujinxingiaceae bacterium]
MNRLKGRESAALGLMVCLGILLGGVGTLQAEPFDAEIEDDVAESDANEASPSASPQAEGRRLRISAGPLLGVRSMRLEGDRSSIEHNAPFYIGAMIDLELRLHRFASFDGELGLRTDAGFGRTIGAFGHVELANRQTTMTFVSSKLSLERPLGQVWDLNVGMGMHATSFTVEPNRIYTGHRYIGPQFGVAARRWFDNRRLFVGAGVDALPVAWVNHSSESADAQSFGVRLDSEMGWTSGDSGWNVLLRYRFQRFRTQFPLASQGSRGALSEDNQHILFLSIGY